MTATHPALLHDVRLIATALIEDSPTVESTMITVERWLAVNEAAIARAPVAFAVDRVIKEALAACAGARPADPHRERLVDSLATARSAVRVVAGLHVICGHDLDETAELCCRHTPEVVELLARCPLDGIDVIGLITGRARARNADPRPTAHAAPIAEVDDWARLRPGAIRPPVAERSRVQRATRTVYRSVAALILLVVVIVEIGILLGTWRLTPVLSGSMAPGMPKGSLAMVTPIRTTSIRPGEVLVFNAPFDHDQVVAHRVHSLSDDPAGVIVQTKGDANTDVDPWQFHITEERAWHVRAVIPDLGWVAIAVTWPLTRFIVLITVTVTVALRLMRRILQPRPDSLRSAPAPGRS